MATNSQTAWWIKEYIKKSHEKNKMEKKKYTPRKLKRKKGTTQREKTLRFIQLSWKLFVFRLNDYKNE